MIGHVADNKERYHTHPRMTGMLTVASEVRGSGLLQGGREGEGGGGGESEEKKGNVWLGRAWSTT